MEYFFYDTFKHDTFKHDICAEKHKRLILQKKCKNKDNDCSICLTSLFMRSVIYLPCKHVFHQRCLNQAVEAKLYTCPLCRYDLLDPLLKSGFTFPEVQQQTPFYRFDIENTSYILLLLDDWIRETSFNASSFTDISANMMIDSSLDDLPPDLVHSSDEEEEEEEREDTTMDIMLFLSLYD